MYAPAHVTRRANGNGVGWIRAGDVVVRCGGYARAVQAAGAHQAAVHAAAAWSTLAHAVHNCPISGADDPAVLSSIELQRRDS